MGDDINDQNNMQNNMQGNMQNNSQSDAAQNASAGQSDFWQDNNSQSANQGSSDLDLTPNAVPVNDNSQAVPPANHQEDSSGDQNQQSQDDGVGDSAQNNQPPTLEANPPEAMQSDASMPSSPPLNNDLPDPSTMNGEEIIAEYESKLMEELGFNTMQPEEQKLAKEKLANLINQRIVNLMMVYMPEEHLEEFRVVINGGDNIKIAEFVQANIPGWSDKVMAELLKIREDLMK